MGLTIGRLAALTDCRVVTIRYYEKEGLLRPPARSRAGYRLYAAEDVERLRFIRHCRRHGLVLADIRELLRLRESPGQDCARVGLLLDRQILEIEARLASLTSLKEHLQRLRGRCPRDEGSVGVCGILRGLADQAVCGCRAEAAGQADFEPPAFG